MDNRKLNDSLLERPRPSIFAAEALLLISMIGLWAASLLVGRLMPRAGSGQEYLMAVAYYLPFIAVPIVVYGLRRPGLGDAMRLNPMPRFSTITVVFAALLSVYAASAVNGLWGLVLDGIGLHEPDISIGISSPEMLMAAILHTAAVPAVFEELLCRGFVLAAFASRGTRFAVLASALLFALMHGNVYGLPAYLLVGAVSGFLVFALDSVYAGMVYHTVYNAAILVLLYLLPQAQQAASQAAPQEGLAFSVALDALFVSLSLFLLLKSVDIRRKIRGIEAIPRIREPLRTRERVLLIALAVVFIGTSVLVLMEV